MADDSNTEQLKLDTSQPTQALDGLLAKLRIIQTELKNTTSSMSKLQALDKAALSWRPPSTSSIPTSSPSAYTRFATSGPSPAMVASLSNLPSQAAAGLNNLGASLAKFRSNLTSFTSAITNQAAALLRNANAGGGGGGGRGPRAGYSGRPPGGRSYGGGVARRVAAYAGTGLAFEGVFATAREVIELDNALHNIQAITKTTDTNMASLKTTILDVATSSKFAAAEVAQAAVDLGQAGLSAAQISEALRAVVNFATAAGTTVKEAATIMTTALDAFGLNASEGKDVANLFTAALNQTKLTADQLSTGLNFSSEAAAELGLSLKETTVLMAGLADAGLRQVGNLRPLLLDLNEPSAKLQKTLARLGISLDDINVHTKPVIDVIKTLSDRGFTAADAFATMNARGATALTALMGNLGHLNDLSQSLEASGAAAAAAQTQMGSLENTARNTANSFVAIASISLTPLLGGIQSLLSGTNSLLKTANDYKGVLEVIGTILGGLAVRGGLGFLAGITGFAGAAGAIGGPWGLGITIGLSAIIALLGAAKTKTDDLAAATEEASAKNTKNQTSYDQVQKAISELLTKEKALKENKDSLKTATLELGEKFRALGLDVNGLEGDFDGLLVKMTALEGVSRDALSSSLALLSAKQGGTIKALTQGAAEDSATLRGLLTPGVRAAGNSNATIQSFLQRIGSGGTLTGADFGGASAAQAALAGIDPRKTPGGRMSNQGAFTALSGILDKAVDITSNLAVAEEAKRHTDAALGTAKARSNLGFVGLESGARDLYAQLNGNIPSRDGNDPVGTEARLRAYRASSGGQIKQYTDAFASYGKGGSSQASAVASSQALKDLSSITNEIDRRIADVFDEASKLRDELARLSTGEVAKRLSNLQRQISTAETPADLQDISTLIADTILELYKRKATEFAQSTLKLGTDEFNVGGLGRLNVQHKGANGTTRGPTATELGQISEFNSGFQQGTIVPPLLAIGAKDKSLTDKIQRDAITGIEGAIAALDRQITDAFKNTDENTPKSVMQQLAQDSLDNLAKSYQLAIEKLAADATLDPLISKEEQANRKANLDSVYASKRDEVTDRTKKLPYDYSRPLTSSDSVFTNVQTYLGPNERESTPGYDWQKNTWSDSMVAGLDSAKAGFSSFFSDIATGQKGVIAGFKDMARGILQSMLSVLSDRIAKQFLSTVMSFLPGFGGASNGGVMQLSATEGLNSGGYIRHYASGGSANRDSVHALLRPGEFVLRNAAVEGIGRDNLDRLNMMGNSHMSSSRIPAMPTPVKMPDTNVWVVQQNRVPQMGKNDILVAVADDILKGGMTKQLIKSVSAGH